MNPTKLISALLFALLISACAGADAPAPESADQAAPTLPEATQTTAPSPEPTDPPQPTATDEPLDAISITGATSADGCTLVDLNPAAWQPLYSAYKTGSDPFFQIHTQEGAGTFYFNMELYTVYGSAWTGQLGTFAPDCNANGLCVYLVPDAVNPYWVTDGEMEIVALTQVDGAFSSPLEINFMDLTLEPVPGSSSTGCYYIEELTVSID
jgi:hypothetical protein